MRQSPQLHQEVETCYTVMTVVANNTIYNDNMELVCKVSDLEENKKKLINTVQECPGLLEQVEDT
jgi:hypothetical protein